MRQEQEYGDIVAYPLNEFSSSGKRLNRSVKLYQREVNTIMNCPEGRRNAQRETLNANTKKKQQVTRDKAQGTSSEHKMGTQIRNDAGCK